MPQREYNPSIFPTGFCYRCDRSGIDLARHEVFGGPFRQKSKEYGLWLNLCPRCHEIVHTNYEEQLMLKRDGQVRVMELQNWSIPDFIQQFGKNYLEDDI